MCDLAEELRQSAKLHDYHRSEIDRLTDVCNGRMAWGAKLTAAETEIARLRAALQKIVDEADSDDGLTAWDGADIARAALANG